MNTAEKKQEKQQMMNQILLEQQRSEKNRKLLARSAMAEELAKLLSKDPTQKSPRKAAQIGEMINARVNERVKSDIVPIPLPPLAPRYYKQPDGSYGIRRPYDNHMRSGPPTHVPVASYSNSNASQPGCVGKLCELMFKRGKSSRKGGKTKRKMRKIKTRSRMKRY
jgi:hypothetical protein